MESILLATIQNGSSYDRSLIVSGWEELLSDLSPDERDRFVCFTVIPDISSSMWHIYARLANHSSDVSEDALV